MERKGLLQSSGRSETRDCRDVNHEVKQKPDPDNSRTPDSLGNGKLKGGYIIQSEGDDSLPPPPPPETTLMGVLNKLMSLDPTEVFKDPVDDSFAPNYSKVIKTPMCFSVMQEKVGMRQYSSWRLFVEDFERICYNAMKYNQKRSRIWSAASTLLRQGKKFIEPYSEQGDSLVGIGTVAQDTAKTSIQDTIQVVATGTAGELGGHMQEAAPHQGGVFEGEIVPGSNSEITAEVAIIAQPCTEVELRNSQTGEYDASLPSDVNMDAVAAAVAPDARQADVNHANSHSNADEYATGIVKDTRDNLEEDVKVEILESTGSEDVRPDSRDDATECSSSFGYTHSKEESDPQLDAFQQSAEVESELRDGNGALSSACAEDDEIAGGNGRGKKALNADWKKYRRGIEWRCRWLEVRLNELRSRAQKYDRMLEERRSKKAWLADVQPGEESSARTAKTIDSSQRGHILRRLRRKQVENTVDLDVYMARHPLFSRYDKKKKREREEAYVEAKIDSIPHVQHQQNFMELERRVPDESDTEEQPVVERSSVGGQDSMEQILWKVEALQTRVEKAKSQLNRGAPPRNITQPLTIPKPPGNLPRAPVQPTPRTSVPSAVPRPPGTKGRPPAGQSPGFSPAANGAPQKQGSAPFRRKSSDYDINNMVMPVSVGAKYVEHIKHADIWTPHWRLVDNSAEAADVSLGSSSEEDTDDERFETRHLEMELNEKKHRYILPPKRSPDGEPSVSGKGRSKSGMGKGAGKMSGRGSVPTKVTASAAVESPDSSHSPAFTGSIPKGKRRKRLFNATAFTTNHAQRLAAYLAEPSSSMPSPEAAGESLIDVEGMVETKPLEEMSIEPTRPPETETVIEQPPQTADQTEVKRRKSAASGLQVLANP